MTESEILEMLTRLAADASDVDLGGRLDIDASFADLGFDSMTQLELLTLVESELGVRVPDDRFKDIQSVRAIVDLVQEFSGDRLDADA